MAAELVVLGATGSIGTQTFEVARRLDIPVVAMAARAGSDGLFNLGLTWPDAKLVVAAATDDERLRFVDAFGKRVSFGPESVQEIAATRGAVVMNGIVGSVGLAASVAAIEAGNRLGLANKESLVAGGPVLLAARQRTGAEIIPVDSEHSAIYQCLKGERASDVARIVLTASGGPFLGRSLRQLEAVTPSEALAHPTWDMGRRISIDSATLVNKGLEVIEAHFLFDLPFEQIDVVVHPQSVVHSLVEFLDGSSKAHLGEPDMRVPIQYAITYPHRAPGGLAPFHLGGKTLTFLEPDRTTFPAIDLAYEVGNMGGSSPAVFNAADEVAVQAFLKGRLSFLGIVDVIERTVSRMPTVNLESVADVLAVDAEARLVADQLISGAC
jgi:1-deoxy-D-xylulose-5-phosphate reductoisomerase